MAIRARQPYSLAAVSFIWSRIITLLIDFVNKHPYDHSLSISPCHPERSEGPPGQTTLNSPDTPTLIREFSADLPDRLSVTTKSLASLGMTGGKLRPLHKHGSLSLRSG